MERRTTTPVEDDDFDEVSVSQASFVGSLGSGDCLHIHSGEELAQQPRRILQDDHAQRLQSSLNTNTIILHPIFHSPCKAKILVMTTQISHKFLFFGMIIGMMQSDTVTSGDNVPYQFLKARHCYFRKEAYYD